MACGINLEKDITIKNVDPDVIDLEAIVKEHGDSVRINGLCPEHFAEYLNKLADAKKKGVRRYDVVDFIMENYPDPKPIIEYDNVRQLAVKIVTKHVTWRDNRNFEWKTNMNDVVIYGNGKEVELTFLTDDAVNELKNVVKLLKSLGYANSDETKHAVVKEAVERLVIVLATLINNYRIDDVLQR